MTPPRRAVIFRPGALGDTLVAAPVIWAIRARHPATEIAYLSEEHGDTSTVPAADAARLIPEIGATFRYRPTEGWSSRLRSLRRDVGPRSGDALLYLCYQRSTAAHVVRDWAFFTLVGFRRVFGLAEAFRDAARGRVADPKESEYQRLVRMMKGLGITAGTNILGRLQTDEKWGNEFWRHHEFGGCMVVAVCAGSKMQSKRWPIERYAQTVSGIAQAVATARPGVRLRFVIIGGRGDHEIAEYLVARTSACVVSAVGTTLLQSSTLLARSVLYLGNDTGPMHMAALHGVPCVALFSSRDREYKWHPWGAGHSVLRTSIECSGCMLEQCFAEPALCLSRVPAETVVREAVQRLLAPEVGPVRV